jgi:hypothetical protein
MTAEDAAVRRSRKGGKERQETWNDLTESGGWWRRYEDDEGVGKTGCRLHLVSMGEGIPTIFKHPFIGSTRTR